MAKHISDTTEVQEKETSSSKYTPSGTALKFVENENMFDFVNLKCLACPLKSFKYMSLFKIPPEDCNT